MVRANNTSRSNNVGVAQRTLEVLSRLQPYTNKSIPNSVYIYDLIDQRTLCATDSLPALVGYTPDEIHVMGASGLASLIHPDDLKSVSEHYQRFTTLRSGEVIAIEYRIKRPDGTWCRLRSQETSLAQAIDGLPLQVLGLVEDITDLSSHNSRQAE
ncbi:MAG: PAS domain-containing protein [Cyanosarcina radialis HA8281-LM2]|nr:PAS domain-containing protein [Cyanosarcina radialis HA8281-LM2]